MKQHAMLGTVFQGLLIGSLAVVSSTLLFGQDQTGPAKRPGLAVGVVIDISAHQKHVIELERETLNLIADQVDGLEANTFVITYAGKTNLLQDWSPLQDGLRTAAERIELSPESGKNAETLLNDAINTGLLKLQADSASRVLIVIGEGNDRGSIAKYSEVKKLARSSHVHCFALLVADHDLMGGRTRHFGFDLYDLAGATKGKGYDVGASRKRLEKAVKGMAKKIQSLQSLQHDSPIS